MLALSNQKLCVVLYYKDCPIRLGITQDNRTLSSKIKRRHDTVKTPPVSNDDYQLLLLLERAIFERCGVSFHLII